MDRLMTEAQEYPHAVSTLTRFRAYSKYNQNQEQLKKGHWIMDWGAACFSHIPGLLLQARHANEKKKFMHSDIKSILYLPYIKDRFYNDAKGLRKAIAWLKDIFEFMDVRNASPAQVLQEGWEFDLNRSGQWNCGVGTLIRYLSEYPDEVETYLYMRHDLQIPMPKALFMIHFLIHSGDGQFRWKFSTGGHTIFMASGCYWKTYKKFVNWRKQDKKLKSILDSCQYSGISAMFGQGGDGQYWNEAHGKDTISKWYNQASLKNPTNATVRAFARLLKVRGEVDEEALYSKPKRVRRGVRPKPVVIHGRPGADLELRPGAIYGGIGREPGDVPQIIAPGDQIDPIEGPEGVELIPDALFPRKA